MIPFIDGRLLAIGPWMVPAIVCLLIAIAIGAGFLIEDGIAKRNWRLVALGLMVAAYPVAVMFAALGVIK